MISPVGETHSADDILLCAVNTGAFYKSHCDMARRNAPSETWLRHTLLLVLPSYRQAVRTTQYFNTETIGKVADGLREYYTQHIAEG